MYKDTIGTAYVKNGEVFDMNQIEKESVKDFSIYEVIRLMNGIPLFMEDHIIRLVNSAQLMGFDIKEMLPAIFEGVGKLILGNNFTDQNFKILISNENGALEYILFFIESHYPTERQYAEGVSAVLFFTERENPNAKSLNLEYKSRVHAVLEESGAHEALLVNQKDYLTEGSRSNLFAIIEGCVYTAPSKDVLLGITRQKVLKLCRRLMIPVIETDLHVDILSEADGLFMTGTSPKLLPITAVNGDPVGSPSCGTMRRLMEAYDREIQEYLESYTI